MIYIALQRNHKQYSNHIFCRDVPQVRPNKSNIINIKNILSRKADAPRVRPYVFALRLLINSVIRSTLTTFRHACLQSFSPSVHIHTDSRDTTLRGRSPA